MRLTSQTIEEAKAWLCDIEPRFAPIFREQALIFKPKADGFPGLMQSIVSQQLSTQAARTIWQRLLDQDLITEKAILSSTDERLRSAGLSPQKMRYVRSLAAAKINYPALREQSTEEVVQTLTQVLGIGPWTAQMYALFALGHADVFAPKDLGLQEGIRKLFQLQTRPNEQQAQQYALSWSPWRSVASLALWSYHDSTAGKTDSVLCE